MHQFIHTAKHSKYAKVAKKCFGREASNESDHTGGTAVLEGYSRAEYYLASSSNTNSSGSFQRSQIRFNYWLCKVTLHNQ